MSTSLTHGADTRRLRHLADTLAQTARDLHDLEQTGTTQLTTLLDAWLGADTEQFAGDWQTAAPQLATAADRLTTFARQLHEQADQQDNASNGTNTPPRPSLPRPLEHSRGLDRPGPFWPDLRTTFAGLDLPDVNPIDWWKKGVRHGIRTGAALPNVPGAPLLGPFLLESYDRWRGTNLTWFEGLFVPWMWPEKWRNKYLHIADQSTDWANDVYKDHLRNLPGLRHTRWALHKANDGLEFADLFMAPFTKTNLGPIGPGVPFSLLKDTVNETSAMLDDPKAWWDQASGLDQAGAVATVIPAAGLLGKAATKATDEVLDQVSKVGRWGDDGYRGKHVTPDAVPDAPSKSLPPGQHVDFDELPDYHVKEDPIPTDGPEGRAYDPDFDRFAGMDKQEFYDKWYDPETKNWRYPSKENGAPYDDGFAEPPRPNTLKVGDTIDRLGQAEDGNFAAPQGTPFDQRALPPSDVGREYHRYRVVKPLPDSVTEGRIQPWFEQPGGAMQYKFGEHDIRWYVKNGCLEELDAPT